LEIGRKFQKIDRPRPVKAVPWGALPLRAPDSTIQKSKDQKKKQKKKKKNIMSKDRPKFDKPA